MKRVEVTVVSADESQTFAIEIRDAACSLLQELTTRDQPATLRDLETFLAQVTLFGLGWIVHVGRTNRGEILRISPSGREALELMETAGVSSSALLYWPPVRHWIEPMRLRDVLDEAFGVQGSVTQRDDDQRY